MYTGGSLADELIHKIGRMRPAFPRGTRDNQNRDLR